ncbi:M15 family metallopeptidase [Paenibacillus glycinis]
MLAVLLLIGYRASQHKSEADRERPPADSGQVQSSDQASGPDPASGPELAPASDKHAQETDASESEMNIDVTRDQVHRGDLLLVNKDNPVPEGGAETEAVNLYRHKELLDGFGLLDSSIMLSPDLAEKFSTMVDAAAGEGVKHFIVSSGYRDETKQDELYRQMGADYAMPAGYSEHNLGLSLDVGSTLGEMSDAPEGKWLTENAWKYGFTLRYPANKTAVTGILFEPWHFRYVGLPHSAIMADHDFVLEEYLAYLKAQQKASVTVDGKTYEIFYFPVAEDTTLHVPAKGSYDISGNNTDGVIVTVRL